MIKMNYSAESVFLSTFSPFLSPELGSQHLLSSPKDRALVEFKQPQEPRIVGETHFRDLLPARPPPNESTCPGSSFIPPLHNQPWPGQSTKMTARPFTTTLKRMKRLTSALPLSFKERSPLPSAVKSVRRLGTKSEGVPHCKPLRVANNSKRA